MTPIAGTAVTSERSDCACAGPPVLRSTVLSGDIKVEIGFIATRMTSGSPVVMPPSVPPARFVARARPGRISSCTSDPLRRAASNRSEEHTSELQSLAYLVCRLLLEKKKNHIIAAQMIARLAALPKTQND